MKIHHFGFAVENIENAIEDFINLFGFLQLTEVKEDLKQKVRIAFLQDEEKKVAVELLEPIGLDSPVYGKKGLMHICFQTKDFEKDFKILREKGWLLIKSPQEAEAIKGAKVSFFYNKDYGVIELVEKNIEEFLR